MKYLIQFIEYGDSENKLRANVSLQKIRNFHLEYRGN